MGSIAIVIPFFNINFFEDCLLSLSNQTNSNFRVYVGNDNSPDDPLPLIEKYSENLELVYKKFNNNLGGKSLVAQWERCIDLIEEEEWLMILGDDDILGPTCVEQFFVFHKKILEKKINVTRFATINIDKEGDAITEIYNHPEVEKSLDSLFRKIRGETRSSLSEYVFRREIVERIKFKNLPLAWYSDDLAILEFSQFQNIYSINTAKVYIRKSGSNISTLDTNLKEKNRASFMFYYTLLKHYASHFTEKEKDILFFRLEKAFLNDKKNLKFYLDYLLIRKDNFNITETLNFARRFLYSVKNGETIRKITKG